MEEKHLIRISNADICNGSGTILHNVELKVDKGEFIYLVGKVGSGKSSLIRTLICEFPFENGEIEKSLKEFDNIKSAVISDTKK